MTRSVSLPAVLVLLGPLLLQGPALAQTVRYVDNVRTCGGLTPCYQTIMSAITAAGAGDTIEVFPGVYHESVLLSEKNGVVLRAHDEALPPVIAAASGNAIEVAASNGVQVRRLVLESSGAAGVRVDGGGSTGTVIDGNVVRAPGGVSLEGSNSCQATGNTVLGGGITLSSGEACLVEGNAVAGAGITVGGDPSGVKKMVLEQNLVRGGGISLSAKNLKRNTVQTNFVSGSTGDGIQVQVTNGGPGNLIQDNTSIGNAGCDIDDISTGKSRNVWSDNRFATKCGAATE